MRFSSVCGAVAVALVAGAAVAEGADTVVATVEGRAITLGDLVAVRAELPQQFQMLPDEALYDGIRQQLIDQTLLARAAEADGVADDPTVARLLAMQRLNLLAEMQMRRVMAEALTEETLRAAYAERFVNAPPPQEVRASHILVDSEEKAADLLAQIEAGADFADLAVEHGTDGTRFQGGDLGFFTRDMMVAEFADAAYAAEVGATIGPVETQFGWHLIRVTDRRERPVPPFEEVENQLAQELSSAVLQETMGALRDGKTVEIAEDRPGIASLRDDSLVAFP